MFPRLKERRPQCPVPVVRSGPLLGRVHRHMCRMKLLTSAMTIKRSSQPGLRVNRRRAYSLPATSTIESTTPVHATAFIRKARF